jgi:hypothetical protein
MADPVFSFFKIKRTAATILFVVQYCDKDELLLAQKATQRGKNHYHKAFFYIPNSI